MDQIIDVIVENAEPVLEKAGELAGDVAEHVIDYVKDNGPMLISMAANALKHLRW